MGKFNLPVITFLDQDGQSNMVGADTDYTTELPAAYRSAQTGVKIYYKTDRSSTDNGSWQTLTPGTNVVDPTLMPCNFFGMESKMCKDLKDNLGKVMYVCKSARGGTNIAAHFNAAAEGIVTNTYYMTPALSKAAKDGLIKVIFWWLQGYQDSSDVNNANSYAANLATLSSDKRTFIKTMVFSAVEFDMVVCEVPDFFGAPANPAYVDIIQAAQLAFASTGRRNYSVAKPSGITFAANGGVHMDGVSQCSYADTCYNVIKNL